MFALATIPGTHATTSEPALYGWKQSPQSQARQSEAGPRTLRRLDAIVHRSLPAKPFDLDLGEQPDPILESTGARRSLFSDVSNGLQTYGAPDPPSPFFGAQLHLDSQQHTCQRALTPTLSLNPATSPYTTPLKPLLPGTSPQTHASAHSPSPRPFTPKSHSPTASRSGCNEPESQPPTLRPGSLTVSPEDYRLPLRTPWASEPGVEPSQPKHRWGSYNGSQPGGATSGLHTEHAMLSEEPHGQLMASSHKWVGETAGSSDGTARPASQAVYDNIHREVFTPPKPSLGGQPLRASLQRPMSMQPQFKSSSRLLAPRPGSSCATRANTRASEPGQQLDTFDDDDGAADPDADWVDLQAYAEDLQYVTQKELRYVMSCFQAAGAPKPEAKQPAPPRPGSALRPSVPRRTPLQRQVSMPPQPSTAHPSRTRLLQQGSVKVASSEGWDHAAAARGARSPADARYKSQRTPERSRERFSDCGVRSQAQARAGRPQVQDTTDDDEDLKHTTAEERQYVKQHGSGAGGRGAAHLAKRQATSPSLPRFQSMKSSPSFKINAPAASPAKPQAVCRLPSRGAQASSAASGEDLSSGELQAGRRPGQGAASRSTTPAKLQAARSTSVPRRVLAKTSSSFKNSSASPGVTSPGAEKRSGHSAAPPAGDDAAGWRGGQEQQPANFAEYEEDLKYMTAEELQYVMKQYNSSKPQAAQAAPLPRRYQSPHTSRRA